MGKTITDKIWDAHVVKAQSRFPDILAIDLHLIHEVTSPQAFDLLRERKLKVLYPERILATVDHNVPTTKNRLQVQPEDEREQLKALRDNCNEHNIALLDMGSGNQGIVHIIGPELGLTQPGLTIVCGDSHTSTHGAFGALAFGIGTTEIGQVLATGCLVQTRPKSIKVCFEGELPKGVYAKDLILYLLKEIGVAGGRGHVFEYCGSAIEKLSMEERMTICNMSIEGGARAGLIAPDQTTFDYIKGKPGAPNDATWNDAIKYWETLKSDENAIYAKEITIDVNKLAPVVSWGTNPEQCVMIDELLPDPLSMPHEKIDLAWKSYEYVKLAPQQKIKGLPIDYVFLGSCVNARISDFRVAAQIFRARKVAKTVQVFIVPGSEVVYKKIHEEGLAQIFNEAGAEVRMPGCSACLAMNEDKVPPGKRCASTSNRNFIGRQGPGSITHLMSPAMAAAVAVTGKITDVRELL